MRGSERCAGPTTSEWCLDLTRLIRSKQANVVYEIPCTCGKVYIGETKRRLGTRLEKQRMLALDARPRSQQSLSMPGRRTTPSTGVVLRFCSALDTPWSW